MHKASPPLFIYIWASETLLLAKLNPLTQVTMILHLTIFLCEFMLNDCQLTLKCVEIPSLECQKPF